MDNLCNRMAEIKECATCAKLRATKGLWKRCAKHTLGMQS